MYYILHVFFPLFPRRSAKKYEKKDPEPGVKGEPSNPRKRPKKEQDGTGPQPSTGNTGRSKKPKKAKKMIFFGYIALICRAGNLILFRLEPALEEHMDMLP